MFKSKRSVHIILVAHGSRDPQWKAPFQKLVMSLEDQVPGSLIFLTFMEFETPNFLDQIKSILDSDSKASILVIPVFFSPGGHVANDIRPFILKLSNQYPESKIMMSEVLGSRERIIQAMAEEVQKDINHFNREMGAESVG